MTFDEAFEKLLGHEGGYVNHPDDPGGETNWGITIRVARENGYNGAMREMPQSVAKEIYRKRYWAPVYGDLLPAVVRYAMFDAAVNSGVGQAARWLQRAVGVADDGRIGPVTLRAVGQVSPDKLLRSMLAQRLLFMTNLTGWNSFGRGWARRIASLMET
jgi:lysozyme family protein